MKFIDEQAVDDLAKSSTTLQCIISFLDHHSSSSHAQLEVVWVHKDTVLIDMDHMNREQISIACEKVNTQFKRQDGVPTCSFQSKENDLVFCQAVPLKDYTRLT